MDKKIFAIKVLLLFFLPLHGQQINGIIYYQNSGSKTAEGVQVSAFGCDSKYTQSNGMFSLTCFGKKAGQKVALIIGSTDKDGKNIEVVNSTQLEWLRMPDDPTSDPVTIIICQAGQRDQAAIRYYGILVNSSNKEYDRKLNAIEEQLKKNSLEASERRTLLTQIAALQSERDEAFSKLEEQAKFLASINKDEASEMVKLAIQKIEEEEDVDKALEVLDDAQLAEAFQGALEKKQKAEAEILKVIQGYELKINLLVPQFKYTEAIACYEQIMNICKETQLSSWYLCGIYSAAASLLYDNGQYAKALEYEKESLALREKVLELGPDNPLISSSYNNLAIYYKAVGQYEPALEYQQKDIAIREKWYGPEDANMAIPYNNIAMSYRELGQFDKALQFQEKAIAIQEVASNLKDPSLANSYNNVSLIYRGLEEFEKALSYMKKAIEIYEDTLDTRHPSLANCYNNMATIYKAIDQYEKALEYQQKAIDIQQAILTPKHPDIAISYSNLGVIYLGMEQYDQALAYQEKEIGIREEILPPVHPSLAISYSNIAVTYSKLKDYEKAIPFQEKAIDIGKQVLPEEHPFRETARETLIDFYIQAALYSFDNKAYPQSMVYLDTLLLKYPKPDFLFLKGLCYYYQSKYTIAIDLYEKGIELDPSYKDQYYYNNVGMAYAKLGAFKKARSAFTAYEELFPAEGRVFRNWAMFYALQNKKAKAMENLQKAIELGYTDLEWFSTENSLDILREEPAFKALLEQLD